MARLRGAVGTGATPVARPAEAVPLIIVGAGGVGSDPGSVRLGADMEAERSAPAGAMAASRSALPSPMPRLPLVAEALELGGWSCCCCCWCDELGRLVRDAGASGRSAKTHGEPLRSLCCLFCSVMGGVDGEPGRVDDEAVAWEEEVRLVIVEELTPAALSAPLLLLPNMLPWRVGM